MTEIPARQTYHWKVLLPCAALALGGCATGLPKYAAPKITVVGKNVDMSDVISYRRLQRDDFRGTQPPADFDERMAAVTCVYTHPIIDKEAIEIKPAMSAGGRPVYDVTYRNLSYRALMDRSCSWWNPSTPASDEVYVLQHEQIHFALFEIAARAWSELPPVRLRLVADSAEAMQRDLQAQFEDLMQQRLAPLLQQNLEFDEDTSLGHNPAKQRKWLERVRAGLPSWDAPESTAPLTRCRLSDDAAAAIARARAALNNSAAGTTLIRLVKEAETAAGPPECDSVRARILADKAAQLAIENGQ